MCCSVDVAKVCRNAVLRGLRGYQLTISPYLPYSCRYLPTCSEYARESIKKFGLANGIWRAVRRLSRCRPFGTDGYDPVP